MNGPTQAVLLAGVVLGAASALAAAISFYDPLWPALASGAALVLTLGVGLALELTRPPVPSQPAPAPHLVGRMADAIGGDRLAREAILENLDGLRGRRGAFSKSERLAVQRRLVGLPAAEFRSLVERLILEEERSP